MQKLMSIGVDIVEVSRFRRKSYQKNMAFYKKIFSDKEIAFCRPKKNSAMHWAARFAGKEAVIKALSSSSIFHKLPSLPDIEILNADNSAPFVRINGAKHSYLGIDIKISLSHSEEYAIGFVTLVKGD